MLQQSEELYAAERGLVPRGCLRGVLGDDPSPLGKLMQIPQEIGLRGGLRVFKELKSESPAVGRAVDFSVFIVRGVSRGNRSGFQPSRSFDASTWGFAPGCDSGAPLALVFLLLHLCVSYSQAYLRRTPRTLPWMLTLEAWA